MWIFKKPEPPPKPKIVWTQFILPAIITIILAMGGFIANSYSKELEKKVDNETLKLMIEKQEMLINHQKEEAENQRKDDEKKFDTFQEIQQKTLERMEELQKQNYERNQTQIIKQQEKPSNFLSPEEFKIYMEMKPELRTKYKKYLESTGKDISALP